MTVTPPMSPELIARNVLAERIVRYAKYYSGVAFGGYVRDAIVRKLHWNDLNLWFKCLHTANCFIKELVANREYVVNPGVNSRAVTYSPRVTEFVDTNRKGWEYAFDRMDLMVLHRLTWNEIVVEVAVQPAFPCNDFDSNQLTWDGSNIVVFNSDGVEVGGKERAARIEKVTRAESKMLEIFPAFARHFSKKDIVHDRVKRLIAKGFVIDAPSEFLPLPLPPPPPPLLLTSSPLAASTSTSTSTSSLSQDIKPSNV
jgi:hypothetical protein